MHRILAVMLFASCAAPGDLVFSTDHVDFGPAVPGIKWKRSLEVLNRSTVTIQLGEVKSNNPAFSLEFPPGVTIAAGGRLTLELDYQPTPGTAEQDEGTLELTTNTAGVSATLQVTGLPTTPDCSLPDQLNFGAVASGDTVTRSLPLLNDTPHEATALVGPLESQSGVFTFELGTRAGALQLAPGEEALVSIAFHPDAASASTSRVRLSRHQLCLPKDVQLIGARIVRVLAWTPSVLDLGGVAVGQTSRLSVTFFNATFIPVQLSGLSVQGGMLPSAFSAPLGPFTIPAATENQQGMVTSGTASVEIAFTPSELGSRTAVLTANTGLASQPVVSVNLRGEGVP